MTEHAERTKKNRRHGGSSGLAGLIVISVASVVMLLGTGAYAGIEQAVEKRIMPQGTYIDGIPVSGLTAEESYLLANEQKAFQLQNFTINLSGYGMQEVWNAESVGLSCNLESIVKKAAYPDFGSNPLNSLGEYVAMEPGAMHNSTTSIDPAKLSECVRQLAAKVHVEPVNAEAVFNAQAETFTYTREEYGQQLDQMELVKDITGQFNAQAIEPITVDITKYIVPIQPQISQAELRNNTVLVGECTTIATSNPDRNVNIQLMCAAANGLCLQPGQQLSLNQLVGQRTEEKGFRYSDAIVDGKIESDIGGGICQMAGTLYNAALLADIEIVERVKHTYPSTYLPLGLDATLNWDNKDLVIANNTSYPIYISTKIVDNIVTARIYGRPLPDGVEIRLRSEILREIEHGNAELILTDSLELGERKVKQTALNGYEVAVYKEFWRDEELILEELVSHDRYQPRNAIIYEGSGGEGTNK